MNPRHQNSDAALGAPSKTKRHVDGMLVQPVRRYPSPRLPPQHTTTRVRILPDASHTVPARFLTLLFFLSSPAIFRIHSKKKKKDLAYTTRDDAVALCRILREASVTTREFTSAVNTVFKILAVEVDQSCKVGDGDGVWG